MSAEHVLIVDDEVELIATLVERLQIRGWHAVGVTTGEEAIQEVRKSDFDVAILDVKLHGEDGVDVMVRLREVRPDLPVILVTGHMSRTSRDAGLAAEACDYVIKPIDIEDLVVKMRKAIEDWPK